MSRVIVSQNPPKNHKVSSGKVRSEVEVRDGWKIDVRLGKEVLVCKRGHIQHIGYGAPDDSIVADKGDTYLDLLTGEVYQLEGL